MKKYIENGESCIRVRGSKKPQIINNEELNEFKIQNEILLDLCVNKFLFTPYALSRDKLGNILIIEDKPDNYESPAEKLCNCPVLECYTLAINKKTNTLCLYLIGELYYREKHCPKCEYTFNEDLAEKNTIKISKLGVHDDFQNNGVGKVLLQAIENYTVDLGYKYLTANSLIQYAHLSNKEVPPQFANVNDLLLKNETDKQGDNLYNPKTIAYVHSSYFDKNYYFYFKNGFVVDDTFETATSYARPIVKKHIRKVPDLINLFSNCVNISKDDPIFRPELNDDMIDNVSKNLPQTDLFCAYKNFFQLSDLQLINLPASPTGTKKLHDLIQKYPAIKFTAQELHEYLFNNISSVLHDAFSLKTDSDIKEINNKIDKQLNEDESEPQE